MSNSLDPDQARQNVGPDLDQNCLQRLSTEDTGGGGGQRVNHPLYAVILPVIFQEF